MGTTKKTPKGPLPVMNKINCSLLPFGVFRKRPPERSDSDECIGCTPLVINGRAVHYVLRIPNRQEAMHFFRDILGMKVLRHEEFASGCGPACKGFCGTLWGKTMVGYGPEDKFFAFELAYSYNKEAYTSGNALCSVTIRSCLCLRQATKLKWPIRDGNVLVGPGGHQFVIVEDRTAKFLDPVQKITLASRNMKKTVKYWNGVLGIKICVLDHNKKTCGFCFKENTTVIEFQETEGEIKHADSFGRLSFTCPLQQLSKIERTVICSKHTIVSPLTTVKTDGRDVYRVIVLADPDDHEVCFYDEASYKKLSRFNPEASAVFDRYVELENGPIGSSAGSSSQLKRGQSDTARKEVEIASPPTAAVVSSGDDGPDDSRETKEVASKPSDAEVTSSDFTADKASSAVPDSASVHTGPTAEESTGKPDSEIASTDGTAKEPSIAKPDSDTVKSEPSDSGTTPGGPTGEEASTAKPDSDTIKSQPTGEESPTAKPDSGTTPGGPTGEDASTAKPDSGTAPKDGDETPEIPPKKILSGNLKINSPQSPPMLKNPGNQAVTYWESSHVKQATAHEEDVDNPQKSRAKEIDSEWDQPDVGVTDSNATEPEIPDDATTTGKKEESETKQKPAENTETAGLQ